MLLALRYGAPLTYRGRIREPPQCQQRLRPPCARLLAPPPLNEYCQRRAKRCQRRRAYRTRRRVVERQRQYPGHRVFGSDERHQERIARAHLLAAHEDLLIVEVAETERSARLTFVEEARCAAVKLAHRLAHHHNPARACILDRE